MGKLGALPNEAPSVSAIRKCKPTEEKREPADKLVQQCLQQNVLHILGSHAPRLRTLLKVNGSKGTAKLYFMFTLWTRGDV